MNFLSVNLCCCQAAFQGVNDMYMVKNHGPARHFQFRIYARHYNCHNSSVKVLFCFTTLFFTRLQEFVQCIKNTDPSDYTSPVPDILHFMLAYEWQLMIITKKAGLCKDMPTDDLKKITIATGIVSGFALYYQKFTIPFLST